MKNKTSTRENLNYYFTHKRPVAVFFIAGCIELSIFS